MGINEVTLSWKAPGDDWMCGQSQKYRILKSPTPIVHPSDGELVGEFTDTVSAGGSQSRVITNVGTNRYFAVFHQDEAGNWGSLASASLSYHRPLAAPKMSTNLVPGFDECTDPDRVHGPPLDEPSCNPPTSSSTTVRVGMPGVPHKSYSTLRLAVIEGNPSTTETDEADVKIDFSSTDVRCAGTSAICPGGQGSDYTGKLLGRVTLRITDQASGPGADQQGTVMDRPLEMPATCVGTGDATIGSHCALSTTVDALLPGAVLEEKRTIWELEQVVVRDAGPNGTGYDAGCPSACGDGDERTFLRQGLFVP
jgi:hypothetical protein